MSELGPEALAALDAAGRLPDDELDIGAVAIQFARVDRPELDWRAAMGRLSAIVRDVLAEPDPGDAEKRRALLSQVIHDRHGYAGDAEAYDHPDNTNLIRVTERKRGLPVSLGILWLHAASAAGWLARGLDFPGHFLLALEGTGAATVVDPFNGGAPLNPPALRALIKSVEGDTAELRPGLLVPMSRRAVLLRLQTNIRLRRLHAGETEGALVCTMNMLRLAPDAAPCGGKRR
ncbi:SirB1 family protein [Roseomonas sp. CCTCC AB2023176]|uniref:SirB1 family protein n=1 Tax=Roseomonas sp. CCTCC AB2023176 TaxID=3342640 RepID=UPI0035DA6236